MIEDFSPWGVYYLEVSCGENARAALDYTLHYRSPRMIGIDADYAMSRDYSAQSWPTFVVIDAEGVIQFHGFDMDRDLGGVRRCLQKILKPAAKDAKPELEGGVALPADILAAWRARRERSPRLAFDAAGKASMVYYSNASGTNAVYLRRFNARGELLKEQQLSPAGVESYAADCVFDTTGTLWVAWCARTNPCYDIFVLPVTEGRGTLERLTFSDDDAMCPRLAAGPRGALTVAYYKWAKMNGISRDRNIFARSYDPALRQWGPEKEISPPIPEVEDHTDPDVVLDSQGQAWVVWSYDYHPQLFRQPVDAAQPTIFAARFASNTVGPAMLVGATGRFSSAIDLFPSAAFDGAGVLWCAWDCSEPQRTIRLARGSSGDNAFQETGAFGSAVCSTPELSPTREGLLLLAWSERAPGGHWQGKVALLKKGQAVANYTLGEKVNVLLPQAQQSPDGGYWAVYEKSDERRTAAVLRKLGAKEETAGR